MSSTGFGRINQALPKFGIGSKRCLASQENGSNRGSGLVNLFLIDTCRLIDGTILKFYKYAGHGPQFNLVSSPWSTPTMTLSSMPFTSDLAIFVPPTMRKVEAWHPPSDRVLSTVELFEIIIAFLKIEVMETPCEAIEPTHSPKWKSQLVRLATVNKVFFHAVAAVIWEDMDSFSPFLALLPLPCTPASTMNIKCGITPQPGERFRIYSSRTKSLRLDDSATCYIPPSWAMYIAASRFGRSALFPCLKSLTIAAPHNLTLFILTSACPTLLEVSITFKTADNDADSQAIVAALSESAVQLTSFSLTSPAFPWIITNLSNISTLRHLSLHIPSGGTSQLLPLNSFKLESLTLDVRPSVPGDSSCVESTLNRLRALRTLPTLRHLVVVGNCWSQIEVLSVLGPSSLDSIELQLCYSSAFPDVLRMAPFVLAVHLGRNRNLASLVATGVPQAQRSFPIVPDIAMGTDWTPAFLSNLSAVTTLEEIDIQNVLFPSPLVVVNALRLLPYFRQLQFFRFMPWIPQSLETQCVMPQLSDLTAIACNNLALKTLSLPVDAQSLDAACPSIDSSHGLAFLSLSPFPNISLSSIDLQYQLHLAMFIHTLFPFVRSLTHGYARDSVQWSNWAPMEMVLRKYQCIYTRAIRSAQQQIDTASLTQVT